LHAPLEALLDRGPVGRQHVANYEPTLVIKITGERKGGERGEKGGESKYENEVYGISAM
jgi:hypothetical protein